MNNNDNKKDNNNSYSYSRLTSYIACPRKHYYNYIEKVETKQSPNTIPGSLFHKCCELYLKHEEGYKEKIDECYLEFDSLANRGMIAKPEGLLKYIFEHYLAYYEKEFKKENTILVEYEFQEVLSEDGDDKDIFKGIIDEVYEKDGLIIVRDRKTSLKDLKYTYDKVKYNQQLLAYAPFVEDKLGLRVDAIEIDEVRFDRLDPIPVIKSGKPSKDKNKLGLITYEMYYKALEEMGLEEEPEYAPILIHLQKRGHPLFRRVIVPLLDERLVNSNAEDILEMYKCVKTNQTNKYRNRNILCGYCEYKELCDLDMANPDDDIRNIVLEKLKVL